MAQRRSKLEIFLEVLSLIKSGTSKPTHIMYQANLSWRPVQATLKSLLSQGLIGEINTTEHRKRDKRSSRIYEVTPKGEEVIRYFHEGKAFGIKALEAILS